MKHTLLSLLALAAPAAAQSSRAYVIDSDLDRLDSVNLSSGATTLIGSTSGSGLDTPAGLAWRQDTRTLWTIDQQGGEVGTLDTTTGAFTRVFTAVPANGWEGIDHDVATGVFYLINQDANLYALSPTTGTTRLIGPTGANRISSLESDTSGNLWGIGFATGIRYRINRSTGAAITIVATSPVNTQGIAFAPDDRLYATNSTTDSLYTVHPTTGAMTLIGAHRGLQSPRGLEIEFIPAAVALSGAGCPSPSAMSYYELFGAGTFDLANRGLQMVPSGQAYQVSATVAAVVPPVSADLGLDDDSVSQPLLLPFQLAFPGGSTQLIRVCSNGFIHLDATRTSASFTPMPDQAVTFGPRLFPLWMDLAPPSGGSVHFDYDLPNNRVLVTWLNVPEWNGGNNRCTAQVVLNASGVVEYRWGAAANTNRGALVGFSPGAGNRDPGNRDISATLPFSTQAGDGFPLGQASRQPILGTAVQLSVTGIPAGSIVGFEFIGVAVPGSGIDLTPAGMPGCSLHVLPILAALPFVVSGPAQDIFLPIPDDVSLLGSQVPIQALVARPGINAAGVLTSNLATLSIGNI